MAPTSVSRLSLLAVAGCCSSLSLAAVFELPIIYRNTYAMVHVDVGTPPVTRNLRFDTGSATTWIVDTGCTGSCGNLSGYPWIGYNATASSTSHSLDVYDSIDYIDGGRTAGVIFSDSFSIPSSPAITWPQTFMSTYETNWRFNPGEGFLGLAFSTIATKNTTTVVEGMMQNELLDQPRFAIYYGTSRKDTDLSAPNNATITVGGSHEDKFVEGGVDAINWIPLQKVKNEYWLWRSGVKAVTGSLAVAGSDAPTEKTFDQPNSWAVFDTGASSISVPSNLVVPLYESIGMNFTAILKGDHIPLCTEFNDSWSVTLNFGNTTLKITGDQLKYPGFANRADACWPPFDDSGVAEGFFLVGARLLTQFYSVWDFGGKSVSEYNPRLGLGPLKQEWKPAA